MTSGDAPTVLLVDDEIDFITTLAQRLELRGIQVLLAHDGAGALAQMAAGPQVVFLDLLMPGVGGLEVLEAIKRDYPQVPVILLSGRGSDQDAAEGVRRGAWACLLKPLQIEEMLAKIKEAVSPAA
jgi:two-component system, OmpR family, response regulator